MAADVLTEEMIKLMKEISELIFSMDGCWAQVKSTFDDTNVILNKEGFQGFKFAAASTMVQQSNDVGRMHCNIHRYYKSDLYAREENHVPKYMLPMRKILLESGLEVSSFHTYWKALARLPECLIRCCQPSVVRDGYRIAGIWPVDHAVIMSGWAGWSKLTTAVADKVLSKLPGLIDLAQKGRLFDSEIEAPFEGLLQFDPATRKSDDCAWNHTRCLWTNNDAVVAAYISRCNETEEEQIRKENASKEKEWRLEFPLEAAAEDARVQLKDNPELVANAAVKVAPRYSCSNPGCHITGTAKERRQWSSCKQRKPSKCRLLFCPAESCAEIFADHKLICTK